MQASTFNDFLIISRTYLSRKNPRTCQEPCQESKTCRGQSGEQSPSEGPQKKLRSQNIVLLNSFPYSNPPYSKNVGRRYSTPGGFNPPPNQGRRARWLMPSLLVLSGVLPKPTFQSQGSGSLSPAFPLPNLPLEAAQSARPPSS